MFQQLIKAFTKAKDNRLEKQHITCTRLYQNYLAQKVFAGQRYFLL